MTCLVDRTLRKLDGVSRLSPPAIHRPTEEPNLASSLFHVLLRKRSARERATEEIGNRERETEQKTKRERAKGERGKDRGRDRQTERKGERGGGGGVLRMNGI